MKSRHKMLFNCSIETLNEIFKENSFSRELCETKGERLLSWKPRFKILENSNKSLSIEYTRNKYRYKLHFIKVSSSLVKCMVESLVPWSIWLIILSVLFIIAIVNNNDNAYAGVVFFIMISIIRLAAYKLSANAICSRIKKNYEKNETFLKLFESLNADLELK